MEKYLFSELTEQIIGYAIEVHRELGPGLLESAYQQCLAYELSKSSLSFSMEKELPVTYKQVHLDCGYPLDFVVEDKVIIELKSVEKILPIHHAQILTYMKLADLKIGLLVNFNVQILKNGIERLIL